MKRINLFKWKRGFVCFVLTVSALTVSAFADYEPDPVAGTCPGCGSPVVVYYSSTKCDEPTTYCDNCKRTALPLPSKKYHNWVLENSTATCTTPGSNHAVCSNCNITATDTEIIPALGHDLGDPERIDATCTASGAIRRSCTRCDYIESEELSALGHSWEETRTEPTCTANGSIVNVCSACGETESETLPALDHDWNEFSHTDPTCTDPGSAEYQCSRCGFAKSEPIPALGVDHIWAETGRTDPTETSAGLVEYTCSTCGTFRTESLPATGPSGADITMSGLLAQMTDVFSVILDWVGVVTQMVVANPILLLCVVICFIGTGVVLFKRLLSI